MKASTSAIWRQSAPWLVLAVLASLVLGVRLQLSFDLSAFFPQRTDFTHELLLEQFRNGPGSRLLVIGISGAPKDRLEVLSDRLRQELAANPAFAMVQNGEFSNAAETVPEPVKSYYLLLDNVDYSRASLELALQSRLQDLAFGGGATLLGLVARDPFLITLDVLDRLVPVDMDGEMWFAENGSAVIMAATRATAIDLAAQAKAVEAVEATFASLPAASPLELEITGVGAFGVEVQKTIRAESQKLSIFATFALCLVVLFFYRSPRLLLLAAIPVGMGFLVGLAIVSLAFDTVHGITLAFGFTLLGVAIDYPMHLFSHARLGGRTAIKSIWPTMKLGAFSTGIAYLALAMSGSDGLAQLGIFTAAGVTVAALVTRLWLPLLLPEQILPPELNAATQQPALNYIPAIVVLGLALALFMSRYSVDAGLWDDRLASLSPVPEQRLQTDMALRSAAGTPDMRYQLVMHNASLESLLIQSENMELRLVEAASDGLLESWRSVSQLLPSHRLQSIRQGAIPAKTILQTRLSEAIAGTPFHADAFDPFLAAAKIAKTLLPLEPADFSGTPLQSWLDSHLLKLGEQWISITSVNGPRARLLSERVKTWSPDIELVDLQQSSVDLMRNYRTGALTTVSYAALIIVVLIWMQRRQPGQILWIALTITIALAVTVTFVSVFQGQLTVIHLVALLLVLGLGLDYALFLSRPETVIERQASNRAVLACAMSTALAFGVLAISSIPVLKFLGFTVAVGSATSYLLALAGSRWPQRSVS